MKSLIYSFTGSIKVLIGFLVLGLLSGCQKELIENGNTSGLESLSATAVQSGAKISNFLVITKSESLPAGFEAKISKYGKIIRSMPEIGEIVVKPSVSGFESIVSKLTEVQAVIPDIVTRWIDPAEFSIEANPPSIGSDEPFFKYQWGMDAINAPEAWNAGYTGSGVRVFILDTGVDSDNPDLSPNLNTGLSTSFVPGESYNVRNGSFFSHGTHVAGIVAAADNKFGVIGTSPGAEIVMVKVLSEYNGSGAFSWINAGIIYAANNDADVINMSLGGTFNKNGYYYDEQGVLQKLPAVYMQSYILAQKRAVNYAYNKGVVIVASAGNGGSNFDGNASVFKLPAELDNVIAVSATAPYDWYMKVVNGLTPDLDLPASYMDYGKSLVDIAAPGGDFDLPTATYVYDMVLSTGAGDAPSYPYYFAAGTSMASPHVAGVAALIIAKNGGKMSPHEVGKQLLNTADKIDGLGISAYYGNGRVNAFRAVTE